MTAVIDELRVQNSGPIKDATLEFSTKRKP